MWTRRKRLFREGLVALRQARIELEMATVQIELLEGQLKRTQGWVDKFQALAAETALENEKLKSAYQELVEAALDVLVSHPDLVAPGTTHDRLRTALEKVNEKRKNESLRDRLRKSIEDDRDLLDRLGDA